MKTTSSGTVCHVFISAQDDISLHERDDFLEHSELIVYTRAGKYRFSVITRGINTYRYNKQQVFGP